MTKAAIAEIVTFKLLPGTSPQAFAEAATAIGPFLRENGAACARTLSEGPDGVWTDHITWTSLEAAKAAGAQIMELPAAAPMMQMIDPEGVQMHHAPIHHLWE